MTLKKSIIFDSYLLQESSSHFLKNQDHFRVKKTPKLLQKQNVAGIQDVQTLKM